MGMVAWKLKSHVIFILENYKKKITLCIAGLKVVLSCAVMIYL